MVKTPAEPISKIHLTKPRREALDNMEFHYSFRDLPFASNQDQIDWTAGMHGATSFTVDIREARYDATLRENVKVGYIELHTIPLGTGDYLFDMADATTHIPHHAIGYSIDFDTPKPVLLRRLNREIEAGDKFMLVEDIHLEEHWRGLKLEPVFTAIAMERVLGLVPVRYAIAMLNPPWLKGAAKRNATVSLVPTFEALAFTPLGDDGVWAMTDFGEFGEALGVMTARYDLPEYMFEGWWS